MISRLVLNLRSIDSVEIEGDCDFSATNLSSLSAWNTQVTAGRLASNGQQTTINTTVMVNETSSIGEGESNSLMVHIEEGRAYFSD